MPNPAESSSEIPEVSVVIPTRNRCARLGRTLASAIAQESVDLEVIVVDDGSDDGTGYWLGSVASGRVRVVRHPVPRGLPQARNAGMRAACGTWIAFLDDDDLWSPRKLRCQLEAMAEASADWAFSAAVLVEDDLSPYSIEAPPPVAGLLDRLLVEQVIPAGSSNVVVRTDVLRSLGGFDEKFANLADWDLWIRLATSAAPVACPEPLVACVQHRDNMHAHQNLRRFVDELEDFVAKHEAVRVRRGLSFTGRSFVEWVAEGRARAGRPLSAAALLTADAVRRRDGAGVKRGVRSLLGVRPLRRPRRLAAPGWLTHYAARGGPH